MPGISFNKPLFSANAGIATDWGSAKGSALVQMPLDLQVNRGVLLEIGLMGHIRGEAAFQKYIATQITGQVGAQARIKGQIQMPMNLFREVGFAVRLRAILEAAAGIEAGIGISVGDFIDLAQTELQLRGLPLQLFTIFMEEVNIGASFSAKAAFTAQAYANLVCSGRLVGDDSNEPGFQFAFGYGYGVKGGYGMRVAARADLKDVSRLVARSADVIVDETVDTILRHLDEGQNNERALLNASRPVAKIAARVAYEAGEYIVQNDSPFDADGAQKVALRVVQVILEEAQRGILRETIDDALHQFDAWLEDQITHIDNGTFEALRPQREMLANHLRAMPTEAFDLRDSAAMDYWNSLSVLMANTAVAFSAQATPLTLTNLRMIAQVWAATQLMFAATKRMVRADASVSVIGLPPAQAKASFEGALPAQPHALIRGAIADVVEDATGTAPSGDLTQQDLLIFVLEGGVLATLTASNANVAAFLEPFEGSGLGATKLDIARLMMTSMGSVMTNSSGELDAQLSLQELAEGLRIFVHEKVEGIVAPAAHAAVPPHQAEALMYLDEVLLPSLRMIVDTGFTDILGWANNTVSQSALEEALSSVLMAIFGRSVIVTGDILMSFTQENFSELLARMADEPGTANDPDALIQIPAGFSEAAADIIDPALPLNADQITDSMRVFLTIASEVAKPFPPDVRARIRQLMFEVIAPIPASNSDDFLQDLKNDLWIPNDAALIALGEEMMDQVGAQLTEFVIRLLHHAGEVVAAALSDVLDTGAEIVRQFITDLSEALALVADRLTDLSAEIFAKLQELSQFVGRVAIELAELAEAMHGQISSVVDAVADRMQMTALPFLTGSLVYNTVPVAYRNALHATLLQNIVGGIGHAIASPLSTPINALAGDAAEISDELLLLNSEVGIRGGLRSIILERLGLTLPNSGLSIPLDFDFSWAITIPVLEPSFTNPPGRFVDKTVSQSLRFDLGHVTLPLGSVFDLIDTHLFAGNAVSDALDALVDTVHDHLEVVLEHRLLTEEQVELTTLQEQMDAQRLTLSQKVNGVHIVQPGTVAKSKTKIRIDIKGVDSSFATASQEHPDPICIFINDQRLALNDFKVERLGARRAVRSTSAGISLTLEDVDGLSEGINTLTVSVVDGRGMEHRETQPFLVEAALPVRKEPPIRRPTKGKKPKETPVKPKDRLMPSIDRPGLDKKLLKPQYGLAIGKKESTALAEKAKQQATKPPADPLTKAAELSPQIAGKARIRFKERDFPDAPTATLHRQPKNKNISKAGYEA